MKRYAIGFGALILASAMSTAAFAQNPVSNFDWGYLDSHPEVAQRLQKDPGLVDNPNFIANHPGLHEYFQSHPEVRREIKEHPDRFMAHEQGYFGHGGSHPLATSDRYLDNHPDVAAKLERNPGLVDNPEFVASHPGLHDYLQSHPTARRDWKEHPNKYMSAEKTYQQHH